MAQADTNRLSLLNARREVSQGLRASEDWQPSYKRNSETFKALLAHEAQLESDVAEYLFRLSRNAPNYVDWAQYAGSLKAASNPLLNADDPVWAEEQLDLQRAVIDAITLIVATGGQAGELTYGIDLGISNLSKSVLEAARTQVAGLVTGMTETSRDLIREAIKQSIARGESVDLARDRISKVLNNPVRAELVAHTESVNAYQTGLKNFAVETGAKTKTWESLARACPLCAPIDGETVRIDKTFSNGKDRPSAHPRCRCGLIYNY
ncbi:phage minor head protein [Antrihabitans sp. YC2-6]|uniref:phage minor head protein n=1 Tax=Antrihabitans sp. YC2-6 TaxID=2799498 RepID=UPI0018F2D89E|nr:phage minor head protein [Antrihabitans sp. YC2-6]MBJ8343950.1 hypothetical protein [Antrihabitans sp. YC2-6]